MPRPVKTCTESALDLLSRRAFSVHELTERLRRKKFPAADITHTLNRLSEMGYMDDVAFARQCIASRLNSGWGWLKIRQDLQLKGVAENDMMHALHSWETQEHTTLQDAAISRAANLLYSRLQRAAPVEQTTEGDSYEQRLAQQKEADKHSAFLARRGFSTDQIYKAWDSVKQQLEEDV